MLTTHWSDAGCWRQGSPFGCLGDRQRNDRAGKGVGRERRGVKEEEEEGGWETTRYLQLGILYLVFILGTYLCRQVLP